MIEDSVVIERGVAEVWAFIADRSKDSLWRRGGLERYELTEDNGRLSIHTSTGIVRPRGQFDLMPVGGGTRVTLSLSCEAKWLAAPSAKRRMRRQVTALEELKDVVESGDRPQAQRQSSPQRNTILRAFLAAGVRFVAIVAQAPAVAQQQWRLLRTVRTTRRRQNVASASRGSSDSRKRRHRRVVSEPKRVRQFGVLARAHGDACGRDRGTMAQDASRQNLAD